MKDKIIKGIININFYSMIIAGTIAILYTICSMLDLFSNIEWLKNKSEEILLFLVANIAIHLLSEHYSDICKLLKRSKRMEDTLIPDLIEKVTGNYNQSLKLERILNESIVQTKRLNEDLAYAIIESINKIDIKVFDDEIQMTRYMIKQLKKCKKKVFDLTWSHEVSLRLDLNQHKKLEDAYEECIKNISEKFEYYEIFIFDNSYRLAKLKRRLDENMDGYSCAYFDPVIIPLLQFIILDYEEIIFASDIYSLKCAIKSKELGKIFAEYYKDVWKKAIKIKEGKRLHNNTIDALLK